MQERGAYEHSSVVRQAPYSPNGEGRRGSGQGGVPDPRYTQHREEPPAADAYDSDEEISLAYDQHEPPTLTRHNNRSTPSLPSQEEHRRPSLPNGPSPHYDPSGLNFNSMHISDEARHSGSSLQRQQYGDPIPRSATANSMHSGVRVGQPRHAQTLPPGAGEGNWSQGGGYPADQGQYYGRNTASMYSVQSGYSNRSSGYDASGSYGQSQYDNDASSIYSADGRPRQYGLPPRPTPNPNRQHYPQQAPLQQGQWGAPAHYDPITAAASDVLGLGSPASSVSGGHPQQQAYYNPAQYQQSYNDYSDTASIRSGDPRPPMNRGGTENFSHLGTRKTKAVDVNQPPFTKEYVDQYRQRIKADPDPESHFAYAKYLIEAAKKIGSGAADQRAVRKYRDTLITESLKVIRRLATQGDAYSEAQFFLASCYGIGMLGLQMDHERAYHLYLQAAKQNHAAACYRVAVCNEKGAGTKKEPRRAVAFYRKAASLGDTAAMYKLGMILLTGALDQEKKEREAIPWLKRAAEQADEENPHALHELGLLHATPNHLVVHDEAYAKDLFTKAGQLGYTQSQYKLGSCYEYGALTCPVDPRRSIAWYTKAAEKGDSEAELALSGWYLTGSEGVLQQNDEEAFLWARRAANKGLSKAEYAVGYYTEVGIGTKGSVEEAKRWYMRAAAQRNKRAMNRLTELKRIGTSRQNQARPTRAQTKDECVIC